MPSKGTPLPKLSESANPLVDHDSALVRAYAELLQPVPFDWWCDGLTFRRRPEKGKGRLEHLTTETARRAFDDFRYWLRRQTGHWPEGLLVLDHGEVGDRLHIHALLAGCAEVRRLSAMDYWHSRNGNARIHPYDRELGARAYMSRKYLSRKVELEFTPGFERVARASGLLQTATASSAEVRVIRPQDTAPGALGRAGVSARVDDRALWCPGAETPQACQAG